MDKPLPHSGDVAKLPDPSPGQQKLLDDIRAALQHLDDLSLRCQRLNHVRRDAREAAVIRFISYTIHDAFSQLRQARAADLPLRCRYEPDHGELLEIVRPLAQVIEIAPHLARRATVAR